MRELEQRAYSYLGRKPVLCMDMVEALRRGDGTVAAVREDGVLVHVRKNGAYLLAAENILAGEALSGVVENAAQLAVHDLRNANLLRERLDFAGMMECKAAAYLHPAPPESGGFDLQRIIPLGPEHEQSILEGFPEEFDPAEVRERLRSGALYGMLENEKPLGVVGLYPEGGIGMLAVRQELEGEAAAGLLWGLAAYMTQRCLESCLAPFVHIPAEDQGLLDLYEQLGYAICDTSLYWLG